MILVRRWLDAENRPHQELATWVLAEDGDDRAQMLNPPSGVEIQEGSPEELAAPAILVGLVDSPIEADRLRPDRQNLYDIEPTEGLKFVSSSQYDRASRKAKLAEESAATEVGERIAALIAEQDAPRKVAMKKLADAAGLDAAELALLFGEG